MPHVKNEFRKTGVLFIILIVMIIYSCQKEKPIPPVLTTTVISAVSYTSATSGGEVTNEGGSPLTTIGICYNTSPEPAIINSKTTQSGGLGSFVSNLTLLTPNTLYYARAYATNVVGTSYGNSVSFTTLQVGTATLTTTTISSISQTTAVSGGNITAENGGTVTARGICWGVNQNPSISIDKTSDGTGTGSFTSTMTGLIGNTTYYVRAYATNSAGTDYGTQVSFKTSPVIPALSTTSVSSITQTTATSGGNVTYDGGATVTARGVCWSTTSGPTTTLSTKTAETGTTGTFTSSITGLTLGTTYYVKAYATNSAGTVYGNEVSFTTSPATAPILTTTVASSITGTTAISGGNVTNDGAATVIARGVCWNTSINPMIDLTTKTSEAGTTGAFASSLTNLTIGTRYYVRAYATNNVGTTYGTQITFTTLNIPTISTTSATLITLTSANSGGNVTNDGGSTITLRGICWSTSTGPTVSLSTKSSETGTTGSFISALTALTMGTTYYIRAYATNNVGTTYGSEISFLTQATGTATDIDGNSYKTISIGTQTWFTENLKVTKFSDGTAIPNVTNDIAWGALTSPAYSWYNNDISQKNLYGAQYIWYTVDPSSNGGKNVCPTGWHVPTDQEWTTQELYLTNNGFGYGGSGKDIAKALAEKTGWNNSDNVGSPGNNQSTNNLTGFTALASGGRMANNNGNIFSLGVGVDGNWWCAPVNNEGTNWARQISWFTGDFLRSYQYKYFGLSIRCLKD